MSDSPTFTVLCGDAITQLRSLPAESIHCCVTSPPYYGLRAYGTNPQIWGGDPNCNHDWIDTSYRDSRHTDTTVGEKQATNKGSWRDGLHLNSTCIHCNAWSGELGMEPTPYLYVEHLVEVFREVHRVLRPDGTLWLNLGDSYCSTAPGTMGDPLLRSGILAGVKEETAEARRKFRQKTTPPGLKPKDLIGIPWRAALALQEDGWWLRSDIIWAKPNVLPASVKDRPTVCHEYVFLLSKSQRYYYNADAIREPFAASTLPRAKRGRSNTSKFVSGAPGQTLHSINRPRETSDGIEPTGRNKRSVWTIATTPYRGAHFATMPPALVEPCILAGCPPAGKRCDCSDLIYTPMGSVESEDPSLITGRSGMNRQRGSNEGTRPITRYEQRWYAVQLRVSSHRSEMEAEAGPAFFHYIRTDKSGARPLPPFLLEAWLEKEWLTPPASWCDCPEEPAGVVLDPFSGSGTTGIVALQHGRSYIGIELNPEYVKLSHERYQKTIRLVSIPA